MRQKGALLQCNVCGRPVPHEVIDSRTTDGGCEIRRRRRCTVCGTRITTRERSTDLTSDDARVRKMLTIFRRHAQDMTAACRELDDDYTDYQI